MGSHPGSSVAHRSQPGDKATRIIRAKRENILRIRSQLRLLASTPVKRLSAARNEKGFIRLVPLLGLFLVLPAAYFAVVTNNRAIEVASAAIGVISLGSLVIGEIAARRTTREIEGLRTVIHDRDEHIADLDEAGRENGRIMEMLEDQNSNLRSDLLTQSVHEQPPKNGAATTVHRESIS